MSFFSKSVKTEELCVGETCITEAELKSILTQQASFDVTGGILAKLDCGVRIVRARAQCDGAALPPAALAPGADDADAAAFIVSVIGAGRPDVLATVLRLDATPVEVAAARGTHVVAVTAESAKAVEAALLRTNERGQREDF